MHHRVLHLHRLVTLGCEGPVEPYILVHACLVLACLLLVVFLSALVAIMGTPDDLEAIDIRSTHVLLELDVVERFFELLVEGLERGNDASKLLERRTPNDCPLLKVLAELNRVHISDESVPGFRRHCRTSSRRQARIASHVHVGGDETLKHSFELGEMSLPDRDLEASLDVLKRDQVVLIPIPCFSVEEGVHEMLSETKDITLGIEALERFLDVDPVENVHVERIDTKLKEADTSVHNLRAGELPQASLVRLLLHEFVRDEATPDLRILI